MILLTGVSSCMGVRRDPPFDGMGTQQQYASRPRPAAPASTNAAWQRTPGAPGYGSSSSVILTASDLAAMPPAPSSTSARQLSRADASNLPPEPLPTASATSNVPQMTAFASGRGSGYGSMPEAQEMPLPRPEASRQMPPAVIQMPKVPESKARLDKQPDTGSRPDKAGDQGPALDRQAERGPQLEKLPERGPQLEKVPENGPALEMPENGPPVEKQPRGFSQTQMQSDRVVQASFSPTRSEPMPGDMHLSSSMPQPVTANKCSAPTGSASSAPLLDMDQGPAGGPGPIFRIVNSKRITFNFEVKDAGSSDTGGVDLWCTRDMRVWRKCETARPAPGTYALEVKDEGLYGFTLVARNGITPKPADVPQVWVTVDTTRPVVQLQGVDLNLTAKTPTLVIRWHAQDCNFYKRPITISYAEHVEGPWVPLAAGVENTGRFETPSLASLPRFFYVRVEAVDTAGNCGSAQTANQVRLELPWQPTSAPAPVVSTQEAAPALLPPPPPAVSMARPTVAITNVDGN
jgi:hypothetical protein